MGQAASAQSASRKTSTEDTRHILGVSGVGDLDIFFS